MALNHNWDVKNGFAFVLQFFSLISDGLDGVNGGWLAGRKKKPTSHETSSLILYILSSGGDITPHRGVAHTAAAGCWRPPQ